MTAALGRTPPVAVTTQPLPCGDQAAPLSDDFAQFLAKAAGEPVCSEVTDAGRPLADEDDTADVAGAACAVPMPPSPTQWSPQPANSDHNVGGAEVSGPTQPVAPKSPASPTQWSLTARNRDHCVGEGASGAAEDVAGRPATDVGALPFPALPTVPSPGPAAPPTPAAPVQTHPVTQPALTGAVSRLRSAPDGVHQVEVMLHPADLGAVQVTVRLQHGALDVTVACADDASRQAVAAALPALHRDLRDVTTSSVVLTEPRPDPRSDAGPDTNDRRRHPEHRPDRHRPERDHPTPAGDFAVDSWM